MTRFTSHLLAATVGAVLLGGCATVSSKHVGLGNELDTSAEPCTGQNVPAGCRKLDAPARRASAGIAYFLPRQLARVTVSRSSRKVDEAIKAVLAAQSAVAETEAAIAAAAAGIEEVGNLILRGGPDDREGRAILNARLARLEGELKAAQDALPGKSGALNTAKNNLKALTNPRSNAGTQTASSSETASGPQGQPAPLSEPEAGPGTYKVTLKIELLAPSADPAQAYRLSPRHSVLRDDEHKLVVSAAGLLTSTETVAVDRTADIAVELATFAGAVFRGGAAALMEGGAKPAEETDRCTVAPNEYTGIADFNDPADVTKLNAHLECFGVRTKVVGRQWPQGTRPVPAVDKPTGGIDGIVYRSPVEVQVAIERCVRTGGMCADVDDQWFATEVIALALPQAGPISYVRQDAGFMTRTRYGLAFKDGILTEYAASRPSEILQVAGTPMRIIHGVFDGASQVISLRTGRNNALAGLTNSELARLQADINLRAGTISGQRTISEAVLALIDAQQQLQRAPIVGQTAMTQAHIAALQQQYALQAAPFLGQQTVSAAELAALNQMFALQGAPLTGQIGLNNLQLSLLQSQTGLALGQNGAQAQLSGSNLALVVALMRDQARRDALNRCVAAQIGMNQPIDTCLAGF